MGAVAAVDENSEPASGDDNVFIGRHLGTSGSWRPGAVEVPRRSSYSAFGVMRYRIELFIPVTLGMLII